MKFSGILTVGFVFMIPLLYKGIARLVEKRKSLVLASAENSFLLSIKISSWGIWPICGTYGIKNIQIANNEFKYMLE